MSQFANPEVTFIDQPVPPRKQFFQYSIKTMFIVTTIIAALIGIVVAPPLFAFVAAILFVATTAVLITSIVYSRGWFRVFSIGAFVPHAMTYPFFMFGIRGPEEFLFFLFASVVISGFSGSLAAFTQGYLVRRGGKLSVPNIPGVRNWLTND